MWDPRQNYATRSLPGTERHFLAGLLAQGQGFVAVEMATNGVPLYLEIRRFPEGDLRSRRAILPAPRELQSIGNVGTPYLPFLAASPDGQWLAVPQNNVDEVKDVHVFAIATGRFVARLPSESRLRTRTLWGLRASPDSRWLARLDHAHGENRILIYDTRRWLLAHVISFRSAGNDVHGAAMDPSSRFLATGGQGENSIRVWDLITGRLVGQCNGNMSGRNPVWSRDGRTLVVRDTGSLRLWSMVVVRELAALPPELPHSLFPLGFTADDRALVMHTYGGQVKAWSLPTLAEIDRQP